MWRRVEHEIVIVADSDMRVDPDYLARVVAALEQPGVGAVTCLYHGIGATAPWARLAALGINAHFLPNVVVGLGLGLAHPCFGSTIAFERKTLAEIGGFVGVADCLADDYAIGAALRARGLQNLRFTHHDRPCVRGDVGARLVASRGEVGADDQDPSIRLATWAQS